MLTTTAVQRAYVDACIKGFKFACHGHRVCHYLFSVDQIEPGVRAALPPAHSYRWSFLDATLETAGPGTRYLIEPITDRHEWLRQAPSADDLLARGLVAA